MHLSKVLPSKISHSPFLRASGKCLSYDGGQHLLPEEQGSHHSSSSEHEYLEELESTSSCKLIGKLLRRSVFSRRNQGKA